MLKHLYKLCWNQRGANGWIWAEMFIVSVILWLIVDILYTNVHAYFLPMGNNTEEVYRIYFSTRENSHTEEPEVTRENWVTILDRVRTYPGVEHLSCSMHAVPYTWSFSSRPLQTDTLHKSSAQIRSVSPEFFQVFQSTAEGQSSESLASLFQYPRACIISPLVVEDIFKDKSPIGQKLNVNENDPTDYLEVKAVMKYFRRAEFQNQNNFAFFAYTQPRMLDGLNIGNVANIEVCVRVSPQAAEGFEQRFTKEMSRSLRVGNIYMMNVKSFSNLKKLYNRPIINSVKRMGAITLFLLINLFLGIVGTFWIRTQSRKSEMGLRVAMGSTRKDLIALLVGEGMVLLLISFIPTIAIGLNLGLSELINIQLMPFTATRFLITQSVSLVLMATMIGIGILIPTYQYTKLQPAEALRYE